MNNLTIQASNSLTVKNRKDIGTIITALLWILFSALSIKAYFFDSSVFTYSNLVFPVCGLIFLHQFIEVMLGKTTFTVTDQKLIVKSGLPFLQKTKTYKIDRMQDLEVEYDIKSKPFLGISTAIEFGHHKYDAVTFDYNNKRVMLGLDLEKFDLERLLDMIENSNNTASSSMPLKSINF